MGQRTPVAFSTPQLRGPVLPLGIIVSALTSSPASQELLYVPLAGLRATERRGETGTVLAAPVGARTSL